MTGTRGRVYSTQRTAGGQVPAPLRDAKHTLERRVERRFLVPRVRSTLRLIAGSLLTDALTTTLRGLKALLFDDQHRSNGRESKVSVSDMPVFRRNSEIRIK